MDEGEVNEITFIDTPDNRMMMTLVSELRSLIPGEGLKAYQRSNAVMMRVWAMDKALHFPEVERLIRKDSEGQFSLPGFVTMACATAPLSGQAAFMRKSFLRSLEESKNVECAIDLDLRIPKRMVRDGDE
jgi:hypothetical protein